MRVLITFISALMVCFVVGQEDTCLKSVQTNCQMSNNVELACNSTFGSITHVEFRLQDLAYKELSASYDYLLLATFLNSYQTERPGFVKLFNLLSERTFNNTMKLIRHIAKRGGKSDFRFNQEEGRDSKARKNLELSELSALAMALDTEKKLFNKSIQIYSYISRHSSDLRYYDPEIGKFLTDELMDQRSESIRKLSAYVNDVWKMINVNVNSTPLAIYLFDEYLQKQ